MADKTLSYLNAAIPQAESNYNQIRTSWSGINRKPDTDNGGITYAENISMTDIPNLVPAEIPKIAYSGYTSPISLAAFGDFLLVVYRSGDSIKIDYIKGNNKYTGTLKASGATDEDEVQRSIVRFNVYTSPTDPLSGTYDRKILIFPDKMSMDYDIQSNFEPAFIGTEDYPIPDIKYATVHVSRLFGVDNDRVYASGFNDYANWNLDTADDTDISGNAWATTSQSNAMADSAFTGLIPYDGSVVCFKRGYMHEVSNIKNPFRLNDVYAEGAIDMRTIHDVDGRLIFASQDNVKLYTGANPKEISDILMLGHYNGSVAGSYNNVYYIYHAESENKAANTYTYNVTNGQWGCINIPSKAVQFATNSNGIYVLCEDGNIYQLNSGIYGEWAFETDLQSYGSLDIRRVKKLSLMCNISDGANVRAYIIKDDDHILNRQLILNSGSLSGFRTLRAAVRGLSADAHKIRIEGNGYVRIMYMDLDIALGGDIYVNT